MARAPTGTDLVKYRYARTAGGTFVNISDYQRGEVVHCIDCDHQMVARQGKSTRWHFAHKGDPVRSCSAETVLHRLGKAFITEGFERALAQKTAFNLRWPCPRCGTVKTDDCAKWCERIEVEGSPIHGVRSDLVLHDGFVCAVEIVVTHDLDDETSRLYSQGQIPVFIVRPTWDTVASLRDGISADALRFAANRDCPGCRALDELAQTQDLAPLLARIREGLERKPRFAASMRKARRWSMRSDQRGKDLDPDVQQTLLEHAAALAQRGFAPLDKRLRMCRNLSGVGNLYADLRGTPDVPIGADPRPFFFLLLHVPVAGDQARVVIREQLVECLGRLGYAFRDAYVSSEQHQADLLLRR